MKKYLSFFRLRFAMGMQYRVAALAGIFTQFVWGAMEILIFTAFHDANADAFPMTFQATVSYIWLQQAFLAFFMAWFMEEEIFDSITSGNIAYELCRPIRIYNMWFARSVANRLSRAVLRCFPILIVAAFLPKPYGMSAPSSITNAICFLITMILGLLVTVSFCMLVYVLTFFTVSPQGLRIFFVSMVELLAGSVIPLPFFPDKIRAVLELLPFAAMQNVPLRIYSGDLSGCAIVKPVVLQSIWLIILTVSGYCLCRYAEKRVRLQGG
ncbi:ABC transporter permease [Anaerosporobacter sp.]|uniref:ABC transporter permease n=1 Tax=Anaerosporobacter sp. TaxID=1872529 RepID=UPI00286F03C4|nr:ABC-2 family transporter protein [Anaerosporobacter sp.]